MFILTIMILRDVKKKPLVNGERARDCEGYILRDNKHHFQGEVGRDEGGADGQVNAVVRRNAEAERRGRISGRFLSPRATPLP